MARPLFGGALSALIPPNATDVSELREVPDNQEVFVHAHTDQSVMIELMEYQDQVDDAQAARYHFEDLAGSNKASAEGLWEVQGVEPIPLCQLRLQECSSAWLLTGTQIISKFNEEAKNTVNMYLCLMRLPQFTTDILLTFNHPVTISPLSSSSVVGEDDGWTLQDFHTLLQSLQLLNPGVFG